MKETPRAVGGAIGGRALPKVSKPRCRMGVVGGRRWGGHVSWWHGSAASQRPALPFLTTGAGRFLPRLRPNCAPTAPHPLDALPTLFTPDDKVCSTPTGGQVRWRAAPRER